MVIKIRMVVIKRERRIDWKRAQRNFIFAGIVVTQVYTLSKLLYFVLYIL